MVFFLIVLGILIFFLVVFFLILFSDINIKIQNLNVDSERKINNQYFSCIIVCKVFGKIPLLKYKIPIEKFINKVKDKEWEKNNLKKIKKLGGINFFRELIKNLKVKLVQFKFNANIGIEDAVITSLIVGTFSAVISIILSKIAIIGKENKFYYKINPVYNKNMYKIELDCIIRVKMVHIISVIYMVLKKKGEKKNERTSNRRSYEYGYE